MSAKINNDYVFQMADTVRRMVTLKMFIDDDIWEDKDKVKARDPVKWGQVEGIKKAIRTVTNEEFGNFDPTWLCLEDYFFETLFEEYPKAIIWHVFGPQIFWEKVEIEPELLSFAGKLSVEELRKLMLREIDELSITEKLFGA